uniref:Kinase n=1 Tax=Eptatretus burgeri TaxID=7764 RepID=A0A8C4QHA8_EPTBU
MAFVNATSGTTLVPSGGEGEALPLLPHGCALLHHQVAGHKAAMLLHPDGAVLKQLQPPPRGLRELQMYSQVFDNDCTDKMFLALREFLPHFQGTWSPEEGNNCSSNNNNNTLYIKLEDVTRHFSMPCILDVKIGRCTYDPFASPEKVLYERRKYPNMEHVGFIILGMRVYQVESNSFKVYDKTFGRALASDSNSLRIGLSNFFHNGQSLRTDVIPGIMHRLGRICTWFQRQTCLHFYRSSLLIVYEGAVFFPTSLCGTIRPTAAVECGPEASASCYVKMGGWSLDSKSQHCCKNKARVKRRTACSPAAVRNSRARSREVATAVKNANDEHSVTTDAKSLYLSHSANDQVTLKHLSDVRMIDFAHVFPANDRDEGFLFGLQKLMAVLQTIKETH